MTLSKFNFKQIYLPILTFLLIGNNLKLEAQKNMVGINTNTPTSTLDVNTSVLLNGKFYLGGDDMTQGDPGSLYWGIKSNGEGATPEWKDMSYLFGGSTAGYFLRDSFIKEDINGLEIPISAIDDSKMYGDATSNTSSTYSVYTVSGSGGNLYEFEDLKFKIPEKRGTSMLLMVRIQVGVKSQTGLTAGQQYPNYNSYTIAVTEKTSNTQRRLIAVRTGTARGTTQTFSNFYMESLIDVSSLPEGAEIGVGCIYRNRAPKANAAGGIIENRSPIYVGREPGTQGGKSPMNASLSLDIFEK